MTNHDFNVRALFVATSTLMVVSVSLLIVGLYVEDYQAREQANRFEFLDYTYFLQTGQLPPRSPRPAPAPEAPGPRGI